jgi:hypothetical protein
MDLEKEIQNLVSETEDTLKRAEADIRKFTLEIEREVGIKSNEAQPRIKRAMADTVRRTINELEKLEERLRQ